MILTLEADPTPTDDGASWRSGRSEAFSGIWFTAHRLKLFSSVCNPDAFRCWERVICPGLLPREMSGMFAACSKGGTCGANGLYGVFL
jgi:hypothetical protein